MCPQIKISPIGYAHQLVPLLLQVFSFRKETILNIDGAFGVVGQLFAGLFVETQVVRRDPQRNEPLMTVVDPLLMSSFVLARAHEILHLHLLKLASAKDEISRRYFVAKRLANLRNTEWQLAAAGRQDIEKVNKNSLRSFRSQINQRGRVIFSRGSDVRAEHQIEGPRLRKISRPAIRTFHAFRANGVCDRSCTGRKVELVRTHTVIAFAAVDQRIAERVFMT